MTSTSWGNPDTTTFDRQNLRWAVYGDTRVQVHKLIWPMAERILIALDQAGLSVSTVSHSPDPLRRGFSIPLDDAGTETVEQLLAPHFVYADGAIFFPGTPEEAVALADALEEAVRLAEPLDPPAGVIAPEGASTASGDGKESAAEPFPREAGLGDTGLVVEFIQRLTGAPVTGVWDQATTSGLTTWQARNSCPASGELDERTWQSILPKRVEWLRPGATGPSIKVIQSAFSTHGYDVRVTGVWGVELSAALRRFQAANNIYPRLRIGNPEWRALFGPREM